MNKNLCLGKANLPALTAIILLSLFPTGIVAAEKVRFVYSSTHMGYLPRIVALEKGFFAQQGLEMDSTDIAGGFKAAAALSGGSADIVNMAYFHALKAARQGFEVVAFACPLNIVCL